MICNQSFGKKYKLYIFYIESVFGKCMVVILDGFFVLFKDDGYIYLVDIFGSIFQGLYKLIDYMEGKWFYYCVVWKDMDGDGDLDIFICWVRELVFFIFCKWINYDLIFLWKLYDICIYDFCFIFYVY